MPKLDAKHLEEQRQTLVRSTALIALIFAIGVVGYAIIGGDRYSIIDAIYMTMITLTTVGYGEIVDLEGNPAGRVFTIVLLLFGVGAFVYFFSNLTAFIVEGNFDRMLWRRKMRRTIRELDKHYIVCGAGRLGRHMIRELIQTERPFVVIDTNETRARELAEELAADFPIVIGDAIDEEVLREAGIERAVGLCAAIATDKDNLLITVTARSLRPDLRIVARCTDEKFIAKLKRTGADAIVATNAIGGLRLVSELIRPDAVTFLDTMLRDKDKRLRVEEIELGERSRATGKTLGELRSTNLRDLLIIALREPQSDAWQFNPPDGAKLRVGSTLVFMASPEARKSAESLWG
ncbi:potassium channel family protein [Nannocystaceae bacterium ST9]